MNKETLEIFKVMLTPLDLSPEAKSISEQRVEMCKPLYEAASELGYSLYDFCEAITELRISLPNIVNYANKATKLVKLQ